MRNTIKDAHVSRAGWFERTDPFVAPEWMPRGPNEVRNQWPNQEHRQGRVVARVAA